MPDASQYASQYTSQYASRCNKTDGVGKTIIENTSKDRTIRVHLSQTEGKCDGSQKDGTTHVLTPGQNLEYEPGFEGGCAKMYITHFYEGGDQFGEQIFWNGIIPLYSSKIRISPEKQNVMVDDGELPPCNPSFPPRVEGASLNEGNIKPGTTDRKKTDRSLYVYFILFLLCLFLFMYFEGRQKLTTLLKNLFNQISKRT